MTCSAPPIYPGHQSRMTGILLALGFLLSACGPSAGVTPSLITSPTPNPPVPSKIPTMVIPAETSTTLPIVAPSFPDPTTYQWIPVVSGLDLPVDIQNAGDGTGRLFVVEKARTHPYPSEQPIAGPTFPGYSQPGGQPAGPNRVCLGWRSIPNMQKTDFSSSITPTGMEIPSSRDSMS